MGRIVKDWTPERVEDAEVAPHRYTWSSDDDHQGEPKTYREWLAAAPYQEGDVVYVERDGKAAKARVCSVLIDRDRYGNRREAYKVQVETKAGIWSKSWEKTYPGFIQRGYKLAGLAPDLEGK